MSVVVKQKLTTLERTRNNMNIFVLYVFYLGQCGCHIFCRSFSTPAFKQGVILRTEIRC